MTKRRPLRLVHHSGALSSRLVEAPCTFLGLVGRAARAAVWSLAVLAPGVALSPLAGCSQAVDLDSLTANRHQPDASSVTGPVDALPVVDAPAIVDTAVPFDAGASEPPQDAEAHIDLGADSILTGAGSPDGSPSEDGGMGAGLDGTEGCACPVDASESPDSSPGDDGGYVPPPPPATADAASTPDGPEGMDGMPDTTPMCARLPSHFATLYLFNNGSATTNCGYARSSLSGYIAAVDPKTFAGSAACGACLQVETAAAVVVAQVVELGASATANNPSAVEVNRAALNLLLPDGSTFADQGVAWRFVPCPIPPATGMTFQFQEGSNANYAALLIQRHRFRLARVEYRSNGRYRSLTRASYNYWVADGGMGGGPFTLRITDVDGHSVEQAGVPLRPGVVFQGQAQFPECTSD